MKSDPQSSHILESGGSSLSSLGGSAAEVGAKRSRQQLRRERQRESARKCNREINLAAISSSPPPATPHPLSAQNPEAEGRQLAKKNFDDVSGATQKRADSLGKISRSRNSEPAKPWPSWLPGDFTKEEFLELTKHVCPAPSVSTGPGIPTYDDLPSFSGTPSEFAAWSSQVNLLLSIETGHTATSVAAIVLGKLTGTATRRAAGFHLHHPKLWDEMMSNQMPPVIALTSLLHHISIMCSDVEGGNAPSSTPGPTSPDPSRTLIACELLGITTLQRCQRILCYCNRPLRIGKNSLPPQLASSPPGTPINYCLLRETDISKCEKFLCGCKRPLRMACGCNWDHPQGDCPLYYVGSLLLR